MMRNDQCTTERCPVCHRPGPVKDGKMLSHKSGSQQCSGTGGPSASSIRQVRELGGVFWPLVQFLMLVDETAGVDTGKTDRPWTDYGFIPQARAAVFALAKARPELLAGAAIELRPYTGDDGVVLAGPVACTKCGNETAWLEHGGLCSRCALAATIEQRAKALTEGGNSPS